MTTKIRCAACMPTTKEQKLEFQLWRILKNYDNWFDNGENNVGAKIALRKFYFALKELAPDRDYKLRDGSHISYLVNLLAMKRAIMDGKYMRACNELIGLIHYNPFLQPRIYSNILCLLERELNILPKDDMLL